MREIWATYFVSSSKVNISAKCLKELSERIEKGPPFDRTIFEEASKEVFDVLNSGDLPTRLGNFSTAAIYKYLYLLISWSIFVLHQSMKEPKKLRFHRHRRKICVELI